MIEQSENIADLATALSKVQANIEGAAKGKVNPAFKSKYADLSSVWNACREQLVENGLSVSQFPGEMVDNRMTMTTQLMHSSGQWIRSTLSIPLSKVDAQGYGSATTYARRYALAAVVGVCPDDDDGNAASRPADRGAPSLNADRITAKQVSDLEALASEVGADMRRFLTYLKVPSLEALSADRYNEAVRGLEAKRVKEAA
jgi:hypothetical protein